MCVCVCVCVCMQKQARNAEADSTDALLNAHAPATKAVSMLFLY